MTRQQVAPLSGVRVVDFSELLPGPFLSQCLVDMGAEVIKIERAPHGDNARVLVPGVFTAMNRGKRSVFLNLKDEAQREQALALVDEADILLEGYRPGVMARLGLDYETVSARNPGLVYVSLSGYGQTGPAALAPGHDLNYLAAAGVTALSGRAGEPPEHSYGIPVADLSGALYGLASTLAALQQRHVTQRGQWLDVSITDCLMHMMNARIGQFEAKGLQTLEQQRQEALMRPGYGVFTTGDGVHISIAAVEDHFWQRLVEALGLVIDDIDTSSFSTRTAHSQEVNHRLAARIAQMRFAEIDTRLTGADVPWFEVLSPGSLREHPQHQARNQFFNVPGTQGDMTLCRFPVRLEGMADQNV